MGTLGCQAWAARLELSGAVLLLAQDKETAQVCRRVAAGGNKTLLLPASPTAFWKREILLGILDRGVHTM